MLLKGNCLELLAEMPDNSVDSIVTDPPYELGFMGKSWDNSGIAYNVELWSQALRVLKPGGHLLAFGGSRTYHRLASAVEDAGFEIRDQIMYLYGSGFPKSLNVGKAIDKSDAGLARRKRDLRFTTWMRGSGLSQKDCAKAIRHLAKNDETANAMAQHYYSDKQQPAIPTLDIFDLLRPYLPEVPAEIEKMVRERTIESENFKNREVVGSRRQRGTPNGVAPFNTASSPVENITAPATEAAKQWQGWGTALKPAHEPIVVARKPLIGTIANNVLTYGTGALNIDGSRVGTTDNFDGLKGRPITKLATRREGETNEEYKDRVLESPGQQEALAKLKDLGRWPANVIHDGSEEVLEGFPITGPSKTTLKNPNGKVLTNAFGGFAGQPGFIDGHNDNGGSASRFFYCAKASKSERNAGLEGLPERNNAEREGRTSGLNSAGHQKPTISQNFHPTVKPIALMRYLVKLVTPPNGTVLDPFLGSGTTAVAAILEGFNWMGCEMTEDYWPIIEARVAWAELQPKTLL